MTKRHLPTKLHLPLMLGLLVALAVAWELRPRTHATEPAAETEVLGYAPARWRLAPQELGSVLLTVDHVLVRHEASAYEAGIYRGLPAQRRARPARTRLDALRLANALRLEAESGAQPFERLAALRSEDSVTAAWGGALGTVTAAELPPSMLDALAVLRPGQVSRVVETDLGFHILRRRETARDDTVLSARELVVAYAQSAPHGRRPGRTVSRAREEAHRLASQYADALRADPASLTQLIDDHSDHASALRGGDFGQWRVQAPDGMARELAVLATLEVGGVSDPIDGEDGFRVLVRTAPRPRRDYAFEELFLGYDSTDVASREATWAQAQSIAVELDGDPTAFDRYRSEFGSGVATRSVEGRGNPLFETALDPLDVGGISAPVEYADALHLLRRHDPATVAVPEPAGTAGMRHELPAPDAPDVDFLIANADGQVVAGALTQLASQVGTALQLQPDAVADVADALQGLAAQSQSLVDPSDRVAAVEATWKQMQGKLGQQGYARFRVFLEQWATGFLMERW